MAKLRPVKIWNAFDEFGLLNGLGHWSADGQSLEYIRYPGETNKQLRARTKEAALYKGNATIQGMINNISRDLGISASGAGLLPRYNSETKTIYYLSEKPYPGPSGIRVYASNSGTWSSADEITPQVRTSGYASAVTGWIVWNLPDYDPKNIPDGLPGSSGWYSAMGISGYSNTVKYGEYTQVLEFISGSIPDTNYRVRVDYQVQTGTNKFGAPVLNWRSDFSHSGDLTDTRFVAKYSDLPTVSGDYQTFISGHVAVYSAMDLISSPISGYYYYDTGKARDRLIKLKYAIDENYPLTWGRFKYDIGRWDQLERASIGNIPSFHDSALPTTNMDIYNGSKYGVDLDVVDIYMTASGARDAWYPVFEPGEFYISNNRYYMFAKLTSENLTLTALGNNLYSGQLTTAAGDRPLEFDMLAACTSGIYYDTAPTGYIRRIHEFTSPASGIYYRTGYVDTGSGIVPASINYGSGGVGFYYDHDTGDVFASGINPTGFVLFWEHRDVATSGLYVTFSGGYGMTAPDLNPLSNPEDKVYYLSL